MAHHDPSSQGLTAARGHEAARAPSGHVTAPGLPALRAAIDRADRAVADLLVRRSRMARRVALAKVLFGLPPRDPQREAQVLTHYADVLKPAGWSEQSLDTWLVTMLSASRDVQARLSVAIQGGPGCWSEEALGARHPSLHVVHCDTVEEAWTRARAHRDVAAWLAVHNSTTGEIEPAAGLRREADVWLEAVHPVQHALMGPIDLPLDGVVRVEGHSQALAQCRATLERVVPRADRVPTVDGAHSARRLDPRGTTAVLGSPQLARTLPLRVLHEPANDDPENRTTFALLLPKEIF